MLQFDFTYHAHFTIFRFLFNISVSIRGKNAKFYIKNLHKFRQIHANFLVNWFIISHFIVKKSYFAFLLNISVSITGKNAKFYIKNLHKIRQLHAIF